MSLALSLAALSLTAAGGTPTLDLAHPGLGTSTSAASSHLGLVAGTQQVFTVADQPGGIALLAASTTAPALVPAFGGVLSVDPATAFVFAVQPFDAQGVATVALDVPASLPVGVDLWTQAASVDATAGTVALSNGLTHATAALVPVTLLKDDTSQHPLAFTGGATIVTSHTAWDAFWAQHSGGSSAAPAVDFARDVVIASFAGNFGTAGYLLEIDALVPIGGGLRIEQTLTVPCGGTFVFRQPFHFLVADRVFASPVLQVLQQEVPGAGCP